MNLFHVLCHRISVVMVVLLVILLLGLLHPSSGLHQEAIGPMVTQDETCAAVAINQLAILEVMEAMRKESPTHPTHSNSHAGLSASLDQLQSRVEQLESTISERENETAAAVAQLQSRIIEMESSITEEQNETETVHQIHSKVRQMKLRITKGQEQSSAFLGQLQCRVEQLELSISDRENGSSVCRDQLQSRVDQLESSTSETENGLLEQFEEILIDLQIRTADLERQLQKYRQDLRCVEPFFPVGSECFFISTSEKLPWHEASEACKTMGGDLAEPQDFRSFLAIKKARVGDIRVWLGLSDAAMEGVWVGVSGTINNMTSAPWYSGEPNDHEGTENYLCSWTDNLLNDYRSTEALNFACEYQLP